MKYLIFILSLFTFSVNAQIIFPFVADSKLATQNVTATTTLTDWNKWVGVGVSASTTVTLPTAVGNAGKQIVLKRTDATNNVVTIDPAGSETIDGLADMSLPVGSSITVYSDGVNCYVSTTASPSTTPLIYGRVNASTNLTSKSFVSTGVGTTVDFTASVYSSGMTFSGTNGIIPSVTGRYRASYYINAGSDETANNATIRVVQGGVSLGSVYINQHNSAGSVNQTSNTIDFDAAAGVPVFLHYQPDATEAVAFDQGSYFQLTQLPTAIAPVVNTVAEYGEQVLAPTTIGAATVDITGGSFTLPSAGTWEVEYFGNISLNAGNIVGGLLIADISNTEVANSRSVTGAGGSGGGNESAMVSNKVRIITSAPTTYKIRGIGNAANIALSTGLAIGGVSNKVTWNLIAGTVPSTGQSVDYVNVALTANITPAANSPIIFQTIKSGNIPYNNTNGNFSLTAGKTYKLSAFAAGQVASAYYWYDVTSGVSLGVNGYNATSGQGSIPSDVIFTPTINTIVQVRLNVSGLLYGSPIIGNNTTTHAIITQLGSSNLLTTNSQINATDGYTDIPGTDVRMQWGTLLHVPSTGPITFPAPFANTNYTVVVSSAAAVNLIVSTGAKATTNFSCTVLTSGGSPSTNNPISYYAIGQKP